MAEDKHKKGQFNLDKGGKKFDLNKGEGKKFDLSKGEGRKFDLDKSEGKKFDLSKGDTIPDTPQAKSQPKPQPKPTPASQPLTAKPQAPTPQPQPLSPNPNKGEESSDTTPNEGETKPSGKGKWIIAAIIVVALILAGVWYFNRDKGQGGNNDTTEAPVAVSDSTGTASDSTANATTEAAANDEQQNAGQTAGNDAPAVSPEQGISEPSKDAQNQTAQSATSQEPSSQTSPRQTATPAESSVKDAQASSSIPASVDEAAQEVLSGKYGNNPDRRRLLGARYKEIQRAVNELYRSGKVK